MVEDAGINFTEVTSGILSATFDVVVNDDTAISGGDFEYFAHFMSEGSFNFRSRLDIVQANALENDYTFGISSTSSTAETIYPVDFTFGESYTVELTYDFAVGAAGLSVDGGTVISGTAGTPESGLNRFGLRQAASSNNETITIDNLTIVPEPSTYALLAGLAALGFVMARRRS